MNIHEILQQYWGYDAFRPLQEDIVQSVLDGHDTLALLPTGGGKSICFQVPAMAMEGLCVVVSPLIALMKDQVENLNKKGIEAAAIYSGLSFKQMELIMSKARFGNLKFLYVSPERLAGNWLREHLEQIQVCLLAVDEAHCISQWGYDFRPEYLRIAEMRDLLPSAKILALTASATERVRQDIMEKLAFKDGRLFKKSFERQNLTYFVIEEEDKYSRMLNISKRIPGTGLVYVKNRRTTRELAAFFNSRGVRASAYHGGLPQKERNAIQEAWIKNEQRLIVCTNAFGMGIDKPNVRFVIHYDIPESPEAYYQEAGRAGRDGNAAWCILLQQEADIQELRRQMDRNFPPEETIISVYDSLFNYLEIAIGAGIGLSFDFDLAEFASRFKFDNLDAYNSIKILEQQGFVDLSENFFEPSKCRMLLDNLKLYDFQLRYPVFEPLIKALLRSYGGIFEYYVSIDEAVLARSLKSNPGEIIKALRLLQKQNVLDFSPRSDKPRITLLRERLSPGALPLNHQLLRQRKATFKEKIDAMIQYATSKETCRSVALMRYFDQDDAVECGKCDVCREKRKEEADESWYEEQIRLKLEQSSQSMESLVRSFGTEREEKAMEIVRYMLDNELLAFDDKQQLIWKN